MIEGDGFLNPSEFDKGQVKMELLFPQEFLAYLNILAS